MYSTYCTAQIYNSSGYPSKKWNTTKLNLSWFIQGHLQKQLQMEFFRKFSNHYLFHQQCCFYFLTVGGLRMNIFVFVSPSGGLISFQKRGGGESGRGTLCALSQLSWPFQFHLAVFNLIQGHSFSHIPSNRSHFITCFLVYDLHFVAVFNVKNGSVINACF